jgi:2-oxoglutarate dehydrogenase E2 component (dihydrolipoamide succinyltransferase)
MSIEVLTPNLPESVSDATVVNWHKQTGDKVLKNDALVDLETDKVVLEVPAPESGVLSAILRENGSIVIGGEPLATIELRTSEEAVNIETDTPVPIQKEIPLSPSVRRLVHENALDPSEIKGSGKECYRAS